VQQKCSNGEAPEVVRTGRIRAGWYTLSAALAALGWSWLRLRGELIAQQAAFRTHPVKHEHEIDWSDDTLKVDLAASTVCTWEVDTVAVEIWLPVGQRPPAALIKASWRDRVPEADVKAAMKDIAESYDGKPPPRLKKVAGLFDDLIKNQGLEAFCRSNKAQLDNVVALVRKQYPAELDRAFKDLPRILEQQQIELPKR
jgi:hypothetical protein